MEEDPPESVELPSLWPVPIRAVRLYAISKDPEAMFGWTPAGFKVTEYEGKETPEEHSFPLTESGWRDCWDLLSTRHPKLAERVRSRADTAFKGQAIVSRKEANATLIRRQDILASVGLCVLLGGYGYGDLTPGVNLVVDFTTAGLRARSTTGYDPLLQLAYTDALAMDFSGPGRVEKGGRFIGGGFGFKGAVEGMIVASVLNSLTRKSEVQSVIRWEARDLEVFLFTSAATPAELRVKLSPALARIARGPSTAEPRPAIAAPEDRLSKIERIGSLYKEGLLSEEEFSVLKREVLGE
jgi:hypothetical protein